jgi:hypothetical protein
VKDAVPSIRRQSVNSSIEATTGGWGATGANRPMLLKNSSGKSRFSADLIR